MGLRFVGSGDGAAGGADLFGRSSSGDGLAAIRRWEEREREDGVRDESERKT